MSGFEVYQPERRGRVPEKEPWAKLVTAKSGATVLRLSKPVLALIGLETKAGDHPYFILEADREVGSIRLTPTDNVGIGRLMNPTNRQISLGRRFLDWSGWRDSRWLIRVEEGVLIGDTREPVDLDTPE